MELCLNKSLLKLLVSCTLFGLAGARLPAVAQTDVGRSALTLEQEGKTSEAEAAWKVLADRDPKSPTAWAHLGLLEARQGHYTEAIAFYRRAMALSPSMPGLRLNLGLALFKEGNYKDALSDFAPLLKEQTASASEIQRLTVLIGMSHYGLGEYAAAIPFLREASSRDSSNLPLLLTLAHSCLLSKQYPCVLDAYHRLVALNADSAEAHILVGEALDEMKDTAGATQEFRAAVKADPKQPNAHFGLGYLLWKQEQYPEAATEFQAELANAPGYTQAMVYLADSYIQMNKMDKARPLLEGIVKGNPTLALAQLDLGIVDAESGRNAEALKELKAAAALRPKDVNVHWRLGRLYRTMGNTAEAKKQFEVAQSINKAADDAVLEVISKDPTKAGGSSAR